MKKAIEIIDIVNILRADDFWGTGSEAIEIAKGKNQLVTSYGGMIRKLKRILRNDN